MTETAPMLPDGQISREDARGHGTRRRAGGYRREISRTWRTRVMKTLIALSVAALALGSITSAEAKGCIKGAVVGGVAGHYAGHHGMLGAAAGCLVGRHRANEQDKQQQQNNQTQGQAPAGQEKL
jgi:hypothetical protein